MVLNDVAFSGNNCMYFNCSRFAVVWFGFGF
jgi:hypothetical protein